MHLKLSTDRKFALSDENYLFECMGLTKTTSEELSMMFDERVISFLNRSELVQALPQQQQVTTTRNSPMVQVEGYETDEMKTGETARAGSMLPQRNTPNAKYMQSAKDFNSQGMGGI